MDAQYVLGEIAKLQSRGSNLYRQGLFPSQRFHQFVPYQREDDNVFFSTLVAFTLQQLLPKLESSLSLKAQKIIDHSIANQSYYRNNQDKSSYNFWQTKPSRHFPHGWILKHFSYFELPDDSDDSVMIHLTGDLPLDQSAALLKQMQQHYLPEAPNSPLTPKAYQDLKGFPTFFGKKILREMDACVLSNILYFILAKRLNWSSMADQSLTFLVRVLDRGDFVKRPFAVAPHYGNTAVIFYHLTRLCTAFPEAPVAILKTKLTDWLIKLEHHSWGLMEEVLLATSALRLQCSLPPLSIPQELGIPMGKFGFFQAGMLTAFQSSAWHKLTAHSFFHLKYRCEAYYYALIFEYLVLLDHSKP